MNEGRPSGPAVGRRPARGRGDGGPRGAGPGPIGPGPGQQGRGGRAGGGGHGPHPAIAGGARAGGPPAQEGPLMGRRTKARECAFQMLYQWDVSREPMDRVMEAFWRVRATPGVTRALAERLATGAQACAQESDAAIAGAATNWRFDRIAPVDRTILRLGTYELLKETGTPPAVILDEAVELAKRFGEANSPAFVNGVLDAIRRRVRGEGPERG